jgi:hypothetical protein
MDKLRKSILPFIAMASMGNDSMLDYEGAYRKRTKVVSIQSRLTKKQIKARCKSNRARKARRINRNG